MARLYSISAQFYFYYKKKKIIQKFSCMMVWTGVKHCEKCHKPLRKNMRLKNMSLKVTVIIISLIKD